MPTLTTPLVKVFSGGSGQVTDDHSLGASGQSSSPFPPEPSNAVSLAHETNNVSSKYFRPATQHPSASDPSSGPGLQASSPSPAPNRFSSNSPERRYPPPQNQQPSASGSNPYTNSLHVQQAQAGLRSRSPSFMDHMRSSDSSNLLNPPPPSFSRAPSSHVSYSQFSPCALLSLEEGLDKGFPIMPPPSPAKPHPFETHDVKEEDWARFLHDLKSVSGLSSVQQHGGAGDASLAMGVGLMGEFSDASYQ